VLTHWSDTSHSTTMVTASNIAAYSLGWSMVTSGLGVFLVVLLRSMLQAAVPSAHVDNVNSCHSKKRLLMLLECHFAVGALVGVCTAWLLTDLLVGCTGHLVHSMATLAAAMIWSTIVSLCMMTTTTSTPTPTTTPTTIVSRDIEALHVTTAPTPSMRYFRASCFTFGLLVGCFIQWSSLGANFLLSLMFGTVVPVEVTTNTTNATYTDTMLQGPTYLALNDQQLLAFSLLWSFFTSTLGVFILVCLRQLIFLVSQACESLETHYKRCYVNPMAVITDMLIASLEGYFATGALVGVNMAWLTTDVFLSIGPNKLEYSNASHLLYSLLGLGAAIAWCQIVSWCFNRNHKYRPLIDNSNDDETRWLAMNEPLLIVTTV
jgi:hypothetical protein